MALNNNLQNNSLTNVDSGVKSVRDKFWLDKKLPENKTKDTSYDKMATPYGTDGSRKVEPFFGNNYYQNEGEAVIKTGDSITDIWVNTWIKSANYLPSKRGFMLDAKKGLIEAEKFSSGWGIAMSGNDAYFYDDSIGGSKIVTGDVASINFARKNYLDQVFTIRKRVGYDSLSPDFSDNVMDFFYPNSSQTGRNNYIFIGRSGSDVYPDTFNTDYIQLFSNKRFAVGVNGDNPFQITSISLIQNETGDKTSNWLSLLAYEGKEKKTFADGGAFAQFGIYTPVPLPDPNTGIIVENPTVICGIQVDRENFLLTFVNLNINNIDFALVDDPNSPGKKYLRQV